MGFEAHCRSWRRSIAAHAILLVPFALALGVPSAQAATLCVDDAAGFEFALAVAAGNGEDDDIRLQRGTYETTDALRFLYLADDSETFDLEVSGDWNSGCTAQGHSPATTVVDGSGIDHALSLWSAGAMLTVRLLTFVGGVTSPGDQDGGGLQLVSIGTDDALVYKIESNQFVANDAEYGGGLGASDATIIQVINNVFVANSASVYGSAAFLVAADSGAVYFINNTVVNNNVADNALWSWAQIGTYVANNNFWDNNGLDLYVYFDQAADPLDVLRNNNIASWSIPNQCIIEDNINVEPEYQGGFLNFTPVRNSSLVDAGIEPEFLAFWYLTDTDNNGSPRVVGPHVDIGAFENDKIFVDGFDPGGPFAGAE